MYNTAAMTDTKVVGHEPTGTGTKVLVEGGDPVEADAVIVSVGRRPYARRRRPSTRR